MKTKAKDKIFYFINSQLFFIVGFTLIFYRTKYIDVFHLLTSLLIFFLGLITLILNIIKSKKSKDILLSLTTLILGILIYNHKTGFLSIFPIIFGLYMLANGIIKFISYLVFKKRENTSYYNTLIGSLIDFIFSYIMISHPRKNIHNLTIILGIYLILFGLTYFYDFLKECFPKYFGTKRRFRLTIPIILATFIPYEVLLSINNLINKWKTPVLVSNKDTSGKVDLEILIHVREDSIGRMGHADLCYKGKIYSYGCYDESSKKLFNSIGDGTLFEIKGKEKYIKFCNINSDKTIFCFGLTLTDEQKIKVEEKIRMLEKNIYKWNPDSNDKNKKNDYAVELIEKTKAKFYKFNKGSYKTYFLLATNCVKLVDDIIGATGSDILKINGVITPGTYYNYLEKEFKRKNSNVITKEIFKKNN